MMKDMREAMKGLNPAALLERKIPSLTGEEMRESSNSFTVNISKTDKTLYGEADV
jgi:hypothetical protein